MSQTGASRIVEALRKGNVRCVFGLPGTQTIELFEALRQSGLRTVVATNELCAAFMAGGWARFTGEPGVLLTIPGPGFSWALTGVAEARLDSVPLVHISGAPASLPAGRRFLQQELAQAAIAGPLVKRVIDADQSSDPGVAVLDALLLARSGEPGPVLVQVSPATLGREFSFAALPDKQTSTIEAGLLESVCARVRRARRPILLLGQGTNRCAQQVRALVERIRVPVITTPSGRGVLPEDHPFNLGFAPLAGNVRDINELLESSDLILAIGCKLGHGGTSGFALKLPADRLVHVDASAEVIGANYPVSLGVVADAGETLQVLLSSSQPASAWTDDELANWRTRTSVRNTASSEPRVAGTPAGDARSFFQSLRRALPRDAILVLDSGLHQILARRYYQVLTAGGLVMPTDLQSMGFAIPTAIGVRMAEPDRAVVALLGDGGFAMTGLELLSAIREKVTLLVIVFVDGAFGQIRMQQLANYGVSHGVSLENPDLGLFADAIGVSYESVGDKDVETIVRTALDRPGITILEVQVGDTLAIHRTAGLARSRGVARRMAGPRLARSVATVLRKVRRMIGI